MKMEIPKQLQDPEFRFVLLGKWNQWKNTKTGEVTAFLPEFYDGLKKEKDWMPLGKAPFENEWQKKGYEYNDAKLLNHIKTNNYGVIGGYGNLRIIDCDTKEFADEMEKDINTLTIKTGSGLKHLYIRTDYDKNHVFKEGVGELRAKNYQVVGDGSTHPNGKKYEIVKDLPIKYIPADELKEIIKPYLRPEIKATATAANKQRDETRSGKEWRKIIKLIAKGLPKEQVFKEMEVYAKWSSAPEQYQELTYKKALEYVKQQKIECGCAENLTTESTDEEDPKEKYFDGPKFIPMYLANNIRENHIIKTSKQSKDMFVYDNGVYKNQAEVVIEQEVAKRLGKLSSNHRIKKVIGDVKSRTNCDIREQE